MKIKIQGYSSAYKEGVLTCLKTNYAWMADESDEGLYQWCKPFLEHEWREELPSSIKPYQHGFIFLDDDRVVGYLGFIFAKRRCKGHTYISQSGTTWAINNGYRIYMFKALKEAFNLADVLLDFTPRKSVEESLTKVFKFTYIDMSIYRFYPIPCLHNTLIYKDMQEADFEDNDLRNEYLDHEPYGVKCLNVSDGQESTYIFYRINHRIRKNRRFFKHRRSILKVLKLTNPNFFCKNYKEIVWHLQEKEHPYVQIEPRFIEPYTIQGFGVKKKRVVRLGLDKTDFHAPTDLLYSEEAILP